ncbi:hypothetical protein [Candidatus Symbiopectobacterium sp.]|uniref:hypothetical protein n=1 Tax=Candidatus Symbiopectobacterium sp. TaxID=2816440 RepID=UPI0025B930E9|nr:hypothetical protein [Candidatus Symbiopectobacterium sp.]
MIDIYVNELSGRIAFDKVGNANKLQIIHREGVSRIELNADLYEATLGWFNSSMKKSLMGGIVAGIKTFFADDDSHQDIEPNENVSAKVILSFDSRKKGGKLGLDKMSKMGINLIQEESRTDYTIVTRDGKRISLNDIQLKRDIEILKHGKTVDRTDAWHKLGVYYKELEQDGLMMQ